MNPRPKDGFSQPAFGLISRVAYFSMKGQTKKRKAIGLLRAIFADNLRRALERRFPYVDNVAMAAERESRGRIQHSSVNRWLGGHVSPNLDALESVANFLKMHAHELLVPYHGAKDKLPDRPELPIPGQSRIEKTSRPPSTRPGP